MNSYQQYVRLGKKTNKLLSDNYQAIIDDMKDIQTRIDKFTQDFNSKEKDQKIEHQTETDKRKLKEVASKVRFQQADDNDRYANYMTISSNKDESPLQTNDQITYHSQYGPNPSLIEEQMAQRLGYMH